MSPNASFQWQPEVVSAQLLITPNGLPRIEIVAIALVDTCQPFVFNKLFICFSPFLVCGHISLKHFINSGTLVAESVRHKFLNFDKFCHLIDTIWACCLVNQQAYDSDNQKLPECEVWLWWSILPRDQRWIRCFNKFYVF